MQTQNGITLMPHFSFFFILPWSYFRAVLLLNTEAVLKKYETTVLKSSIGQKKQTLEKVICFKKKRRSCLWALFKCSSSLVIDYFNKLSVVTDNQHRFEQTCF